MVPFLSEFGAIVKVVVDGEKWLLASPVLLPELLGDALLEIVDVRDDEEELLVVELDGCIFNEKLHPGFLSSTVRTSTHVWQNIRQLIGDLLLSCEELNLILPDGTEASVATEWSLIVPEPEPVDLKYWKPLVVKV